MFPDRQNKSTWLAFIVAGMALLLWKNKYRCLCLNCDSFRQMLFYDSVVSASLEKKWGFSNAYRADIGI